MTEDTPTLMEQAQDAFDIFDYIRSFKLAQAAAEHLRDTKGKLVRARALYLAARAALANDDTLPAQECFEQAAELFHSLGERHSMLACRIELAKIAGRQGELAQSKQLAAQILKDARARGYQDLEAHALATLGNTAWKIGNAETSITLLSQAVELFSKLRLAPEANNARGSLGVALVIAGRLDESMAVSKRALDYYRAKGDTRAMAKVMLNLGFVAYAHGEYGIARSYLRRLSEMEDVLQDRSLVMTISYNLGQLELQEGRPKQAKQPLTRAYHLAQEVSDQVVEGTALMYLAVVSIYEGLPEEALNYMELSERRLAGSLSDESRLMRYYLPVMLLAVGQSKRATQLWRQKPELGSYESCLDDLHNLHLLLSFMLRPAANVSLALTAEAHTWAAQWLAEVDEQLVRYSHRG